LLASSGGVGHRAEMQSVGLGRRAMAAAVASGIVGAAGVVYLTRGYQVSDSALQIV